VRKLDRLQDEDLSSESSAVEQTPSGDQSLEQQGNNRRQAAATDLPMPLEDAKPASTEGPGATVDRDRGVDRKLLERLQVVGLPSRTSAGWTAGHQGCRAAWPSC